MTKSKKLVMNILRYAVYNNPDSFNLRKDKLGNYKLTDIISTLGEVFNLTWIDIIETLHSDENNLFDVHGENVSIKK